MSPFVITSAVNKSLNGGLSGINLQPSNGLNVNRQSSNFDLQPALSNKLCTCVCMHVNNYGKRLPLTVKQPKTKPAMVENLNLR